MVSEIECHNGNWSQSINEVGCSPSVFYLFGGRNTGKTVEIYHPSIDNVLCSTSPPPLDHDWRKHTIFSHRDSIYLCGGYNTPLLCSSYNIYSQVSQWTPHTIVEKDHLSKTESFATKLTLICFRLFLQSASSISLFAQVQLVILARCSS